MLQIRNIKFAAAEVALRPKVQIYLVILFLSIHFRFFYHEFSISAVIDLFLCTAFLIVFLIWAFRALTDGVIYVRLIILSSVLVTVQIAFSTMTICAIGGKNIWLLIPNIIFKVQRTFNLNDILERID